MKLRIHLFEWPSRHNVHLALPIMLVLSFSLHAACMFIFHATFPRFRRQSPSAFRCQSITFCQARRKRRSSRRCWPRRIRHCFSSTKIFGRNVWKLPETSYVASFDEEIPALAPPAGSASVAVSSP